LIDSYTVFLFDLIDIGSKTATADADGRLEGGVRGRWLLSTTATVADGTDLSAAAIIVVVDDAADARLD
jgi:hypothetical protein